MGADMSEPLELRVLSGVHAQARCPVRDNDILGADLSCDVVLTDAGLAAKMAHLRLGPTGWALAFDNTELATSNSEPETPFNQPLSLGPIWITIARRSDPWIDLPPAVSTDLANPGDTRHTEAVDTTQMSQNYAPTAEIDVGKIGGPPSRNRSERWLMLIGLGTVGVAVFVAMLVVWLLPGTENASMKQPDPRAAAEQSLGAVNAAIERLGLSSRLHVAITPQGTVYVTGWVRDAQERDALASALAQVWPMPAMRVSSEEAAMQTAAMVLKSFSVKYMPRYDGDGRLTILGIADSADGRAAALDALRGQLPGMTVLGNDIYLSDAVTTTLATELSNAGLSGAALTWKDNMLQVSTEALDDIQMAEIQSVVDQFNSRYFGVAKLATTGRQVADTVPFRIRSVVSGPLPFIVLEDGSKLLVGGTYRRYRLTAIEDKRLLFEGPRSAIVLR